MTVNTKKADWDKENMSTVSCRLRKEIAQKFREYAEYEGVTPNSLLAEFVRKCISLYEDIDPVSRTNVEALRKEIALLRRKLKIAKTEVDQARLRALNAEALVDQWLRSADDE